MESLGSHDESHIRTICMHITFQYCFYPMHIIISGTFFQYRFYIIFLCWLFFNLQTVSHMHSFIHAFIDSLSCCKFSAMTPPGLHIEKYATWIKVGSSLEKSLICLKQVLMKWPPIGVKQSALDWTMNLNSACLFVFIPFLTQSSLFCINTIQHNVFHSQQ